MKKGVSILSWEPTKQSEKNIDGIGKITITNYSDDWNRYKTDVFIESSTHHIEESTFYKPSEGAITNYYAVPNGQTINNNLILPEITNEKFPHLTARTFSKRYLSEKLKQLQQKRANFETHMNHKNTLAEISNHYFKYYENGNREHCEEQVKLSIEVFDSYAFNFENWGNITAKAEAEKERKDSEIKKISTLIY